MAADFESELQKAWEAADKAHGGCHKCRGKRVHGTNNPLKDEWEACDYPLHRHLDEVHTALLEMVHAYVMAQVPYTMDVARIERRLRAIVGVGEGK